MIVNIYTSCYGFLLMNACFTVQSYSPNLLLQTQLNPVQHPHFKECGLRKAALIFGQHPSRYPTVGLNPCLISCDHYHSLQYVICLVKETPCPPRKHASTSVLPSLQHGTLQYPRPRPTILDSSSLKRNKGKARALVESDDDYMPDIEEDHEDDHQQEKIGVGEEVRDGTQVQEDGFEGIHNHDVHGKSANKSLI